MSMDEIRLDLAELKYKPPEPVADAVSSVSVNQYPPSDYTELKEALADYTGVAPQQIVFGNGTDEIIDMCTRVWGGTNIVPVPTFGQYADAAERAGQEVVERDMMENREYVYSLSETDVEADIIWVCTPNNPTGTVVPETDIRTVLERASGMVIVDECYVEYCSATVIDLIDAYENLVVLRSFSKNFGLAGLRVGAAVSQEQNINDLERIRQPFNVNRAAMTAAISALENVDQYQSIWETVLNTGENFAAGLQDIGYKVFPVNANFVLCDTESEEEARRLVEYLDICGISVFPGWDEEFTGLPNSCIRFTVGKPEDMRAALEAVQDFREKYNKV